jgi:hypothetical protein
MDARAREHLPNTRLSLLFARQPVGSVLHPSFGAIDRHKAPTLASLVGPTAITPRHALQPRHPIVGPNCSSSCSLRAAKTLSPPPADCQSIDQSINRTRRTHTHPTNFDDNNNKHYQQQKIAL